MSLQDIEHGAGAIREAARVLGPGGRLCFAIVHPAAAVGVIEGGIEDAELVIRGSYLDAHEEERPLGQRTVTQYHRPLEWYSRALEGAGFLVEALRELPTRRRAPGRLPLFLDLRAVKP
jgi:hypothetical protein